jgi:hypothetical protein
VEIAWFCQRGKSRRCVLRVRATQFGRRVRLLIRDENRNLAVVSSLTSSRFPKSREENLTSSERRNVSKKGIKRTVDNKKRKAKKTGNAGRRALFDRHLLLVEEKYTSATKNQGPLLFFCLPLEFKVENLAYFVAVILAPIMPREIAGHDRCAVLKVVPKQPPRDRLQQETYNYKTPPWLPDIILQRPVPIFCAFGLT